jgi:hypothetical protein
MIEYPGGDHQNPAKMSMQLTGLWEEIIINNEQAARPADARSALAMQKN